MRWVDVFVVGLTGVVCVVLVLAISAPLWLNPVRRQPGGLGGLLLIQRPEDTPPAFWDALQPIRWLSVLGCVALILAVGYWTIRTWNVVAAVSGEKTSLKVWLPAGFGLSAAVLGLAFLMLRTILYGRMKRRFFERVSREEFRVCLDCGYSLEGLPDMHPCPECGRQFFSAPTAVAWKRWMDCDDERITWH